MTGLFFQRSLEGSLSNSNSVVVTYTYVQSFMVVEWPDRNVEKVILVNELGRMSQWEHFFFFLGL